MKRLLAAAVVAVCLTVASASSTQAATYRGFPMVNIYVGGKRVETDVPGIVLDGRTMVPVRFVSEALGQKVWWDGSLRAVYVGDAPIIGDEGITPDQLKDAQKVALKTWESVESYFGESGEHPFIFLFSTGRRWMEHLRAEGMSESDAQKVARYASGRATDHVEVVASDGSPSDLTYGHEFCHVVMRRRGLVDRMPYWLAEGIAEYVAREVTGRSRSSPKGGYIWAEGRKALLPRAIEGSLKPLPSSADTWSELFGEYPVHAQAVLAVDYLLSSSAPGALKAYLSRVLAGDEENRAFVGAFGRDLAGFEREFVQFLREEGARKAGGVSIRMEVPKAFSGLLSVFPPNSLRSTAWKVRGGGALDVVLRDDGTLKVDLPTQLTSGYRLKGGEAEDLLVFLDPDPGYMVTDGGKRLNQVCLVFKKTSYDWYWSRNVTFWEDGSSDVNADDPGYPIGLKLLEVKSIREPEA